MPVPGLGERRCLGKNNRRAAKCESRPVHHKNPISISRTFHWLSKDQRVNEEIIKKWGFAEKEEGSIVSVKARNG